MPVPLRGELGVLVEVDVALLGGALGVVVEALDVRHEALARGRERLVLDGVAREELAARFGADGDALVVVDSRARLRVQIAGTVFSPVAPGTAPLPKVEKKKPAKKPPEEIKRKKPSKNMLSLRS